MRSAAQSARLDSSPNEYQRGGHHQVGAIRGQTCPATETSVPLRGVWTHRAILSAGASLRTRGGGPRKGRKFPQPSPRGRKHALIPHEVVILKRNSRIRDHDLQLRVAKDIDCCSSSDADWRAR
jgi:hypothetical protein